MSNLHRIRWFDGQIREGRYPNSAALAERFEISRRQAQRDIKYLAYSLSAPLLYVAKYRGYCYEDKTYALPLLYMTDEEQKILNYLARRYRQYDYDGAASVKRVADLLDRFAPDGGDAQELRLPVFEAAPELIDRAERLARAIADRAVVTLTYREDAGTEALTVWPLKLFARFDSDYAGVYSAAEGRRRTLRLDRVAGLTVTDGRFDPAGLEEAEWTGGGTAARKPFAATLRLPGPVAAGSAWQGYRIRAVPEPDVAVVEFHDADAFLQQLWLAESAWDALLAPRWLREKLTRRCAAVLQRMNSANER
ncbi:WYL domain-containing protein [Paenibacillus sp. MWE-103]|uniref:WYL domain-containing protein n=1 Tax=Paenibacillus artemisiicola TaxID=1172618 RepID=A0ABS3WBH0_9BACL|nr:WYL domain-containing protein [Paenibacillus artemisiicola]MBO7745632.1 WYL domain-containing protein [Paenibacillus artemisiicola]